MAVHDREVGRGRDMGRRREGDIGNDREIGRDGGRENGRERIGQESITS